MESRLIQENMYARGAVLGAFAGDAAGATLEMMARAPTEAEVQRAMTMVGGGIWNTAPGQITDDGLQPGLHQNIRQNLASKGSMPAFDSPSRWKPHRTCGGISDIESIRMQGFYQAPAIRARSSRCS